MPHRHQSGDVGDHPRRDLLAQRPPQLGCVQQIPGRLDPTFGGTWVSSGPITPAIRPRIRQGVCVLLRELRDLLVGALRVVLVEDQRPALGKRLVQYGPIGWTLYPWRSRLSSLTIVGGIRLIT